MYADKVTGSMRMAIDETNRRRRIQTDYNLKNNITPRSVTKSREAIMGQTKVADSRSGVKRYYVDDESPSVAADPVVRLMSQDQLIKLIAQTQKKMESAAKELNFVEAARFRDELAELRKMLK
jgi:excinuclease ABC subunit B